MFYYHFQPQNSDLCIPDHLSVFKCLIVAGRDINADYRARISEQLVNAGCLYALAWGRECSAWDDSVDWAYRDAQGEAEFRKESHVVTTWHEGEDLRDTVAFARRCEHPFAMLDDLLVLDFGSRHRQEFFEQLYAEG